MALRLEVPRPARPPTDDRPVLAAPRWVVARELSASTWRQAVLTRAAMALRGFPRRLDYRMPKESVRRKQRAPGAGLAEGEPTPERRPALSRCGLGGRSLNHRLGVGWCTGGGPAGPSALVPLGGERRACRPRLLLGHSSYWGLLSEGLHFLTGAGAGAPEMMATRHFFCRRKQTNKFKDATPLPGAPAVGGLPPVAGILRDPFLEIRPGG